jgi:uncharacterized protein (DUF1778 family)
LTIDFWDEINTFCLFFNLSKLTLEKENMIDEADSLNYKSVTDWTYETILKREKKIIENLLELQN